MSLATPGPVTWLPAHPADGSVSMQRYWCRLESAWRRMGRPFPLNSPLGVARFPRLPQGRLARAARKYAAYPVRARLQSTRNVHVLAHNYAFLLPMLPSRTRTVVTVHDLIPLCEPQGITVRQQRRFRASVEQLRTADHLVADSEYTRSQLHQHLGIDSERVSVIPLGVDSPCLETGDDATVEAALRRLDDRLKILVVGSTLPRKNLGILPAVFAELKRRGGPRAVLLRVGEALPSTLARRVLDELGDDGLMEFGPAPDALLQRLYLEADAVVVPSTLEGFGLPVLEAMAAGCPVVCSDAASLPEVGGDAVLYFDPKDPAQAAEALERLISDRDLSATLSKRGRARAATFTWERTIEGLMEVYASVFGR